MQGSLIQPPIVIRSTRWKLVAPLLGALLFVAGGVWMLSLGDPGKVTSGLFTTGFFGLCALVLLVPLLRPSTLEIGREGVTERTAVRTTTYGWDQVRAFRVQKIAGRTMVAFDFTQDDPAQRRLRALSRSMAGAEGAFDNLWTIRPQALADLLNEARARWGPPTGRSARP